MHLDPSDWRDVETFAAGLILGAVGILVFLYYLAKGF